MGEEREVAGRYKLRERLGHGAMGIVWHGYDEQLHRVVAIKQLVVQDAADDAKTEKAKNRAMREARLAARLEHPNAIRVYDVVEDDGQPWLVMEYLPSRSLAGLIDEKGPLEPKEAALIGCQIASALAAAHRRSILHRDVKPANVLVGDQDVKITDFGISRAADDATATSTVTGTVGTPAYFSPEVARGEEASYPADVFSLGATLYTAVEGTPPFGIVENPLKMLHKVASGDYRAPEKAGALTPVLERMLNREPDERPTMDEAAQLLADVVNADDETPAVTAVLPEPELAPEPEQTPEPEPTPVLPAPARPEVDPARPAAYIPAAHETTEEENGRKKATPLITAAVLLLLLIVALGAYFLWPKGQNQNAGPSSSSPATSSQTQANTGEQTGGQTPSQTPTSPPAQTSSPPTSSADTPPPAATTAAQALTDYYNLIPGDLNAGWARLTDSFKTGRGLDFGQYQSFWNQYADVVATNVTQQGDSVVSATITYTNKGGGTLVEQHTYNLVQVNGTWMINSQN